MPRGRGGYQKPSKPAAVSGPGALSQRTDGGPAQPIKPPPAEWQGQRKQLEQMQAQNPYPDEMAAQEMQRRQMSQTALTGQGGQAGDSVFGPTRRPREPITAGAPVGPGANPLPDFAQDPDVLLEALAAVYPHPILYQLMSRPQGGPNG